MSSGRSPTIVMWARSIPSSNSRSASQGPLRSLTLPLSTSVPVTTIPARTLMRRVACRPGCSCAPCGVKSRPAGSGPTTSGTCLPLAVTDTEVFPRFMRMCRPRQLLLEEIVPSKTTGVPAPRSTQT